MENKVLFCATVDYHFQKFHIPFLRWFKEQGWEVHVAAKGKLSLPFVDEKFDMPFERSPFRASNFQAYRELRELINNGGYRIIHCHTPVGGGLTRLAAREARRQGTHVLYTAHGFHFFKGAPWLNWAMYYPAERWLAKYTDCLITINEEDYRRAIERRFSAGRILRVHGVGVDIDLYRPVTKAQKTAFKERNGFLPEHILMFYAAEFNANKNQRLLIEAFALAKHEMPNAQLLLAGEGRLRASCEELAARLGVLDRVRFLGYRDDIADLLPMCDVALASSLREGLPVNIVEAMACGLPVLASRNRGHSELVADGVNGYIVSSKDAREMAAKMASLYRLDYVREQFGQESRRSADRYSLGRVEGELSKIYLSYLDGAHGVTDEEKGEWTKVPWGVQ
ncbi:glycosyltransferase family 4 protein [Paenibacillus antri]|uniref:Glycosyltransferase family 4 protein n=1 Tax=Paenibacillus antri TaxID=2582848 RepID=A0A5R9G7I8_9BACL|nr:glycosyltransferase family 4 protein [Paenibacillus antri]TLS49398.1 glycosyltransferase family 4 protein [Paenibacillus antri]